MNYARVGQSENTNTVTGDKLLPSYGRDPCDRRVAWKKEGQRTGDSPIASSASPPSRRPLAVSSTYCPTTMRQMMDVSFQRWLRVIGAHI